MKPDEEMRADMEEQDLEPCDLFVDLGMLVIEGRIPGLTSRGYGEGPHCPPLSGQSRHKCDPHDSQCIREENFRKHMLLLWRNNIPMSIEVLLCPECCHGNGKQQGVESLAVPEPSYILLEQWTIQMLTRRVPEVSMSGKNLLHAVRSYSHFSQLSAWYSLSGGKAPQNVVYRICVPGEAFSNKFIGPPDAHVFPIANVGRSNAMKVSVRAMPRSVNIPTVYCRLHDKSTSASKDNEANKLSMACALAPEDTSILEKDEMLPFEMQRKQRDSPTDTLLGDSLLDPPQSLQMYPKRYQSPSRSGSPVMETPEHLMFGSSTRDGHSAKGHRNFEPKERSRQRRSYAEKHYMQPRCLEKEITDTKMIHLNEKHSPTMQNVLKDTNPTNSGNNGSCYFALTPKETEEILNVLRQRSTYRTNINYCKIKEKRDDSSACHIKEKYNSSCKSHNVKCVQEIETSKKRIPNESISEPSNLSQGDLILNRKEKIGHGKNDTNAVLSSQNFSNEKCIQRRTPSSFNVDNLLKKHNLNNTVDYSQTLTNFSNDSVDNCNKSSSPHSKLKNILASTSDENSGKCKHDANSSHENSCKILNLHQSSNNNHQSANVRNEMKKPSLTSSNSYNNAINPAVNLLKRVLDKQMIIENSQEKDAKSNSKSIPSAMDKVNFRRSLDSATSMVFHCKTGLPLTSSPAPLRKGTCFDFDSSLTTVSAIKNALFEKDENEMEDLPKVLSISEPTTFTNNRLLGSFEESVLNGRLEPVSTVEGFTAEIGASGSFCPRHITMPVTVFFYTLTDTDKVSTPYMGHINLGPKGYHVPKKGTVQITLFNPHGTVVKMFVIMYDLHDMPVNCQTFLRQRTLYMPVGASDEDEEASKWLRYLIHLRFASSKSGRIYLHTDIRMVIFRKSDMDASTIMGTYEFRSFTKGPVNPKFSPKR